MIKSTKSFVVQSKPFLYFCAFSCLSLDILSADFADTHMFSGRTGKLEEKGKWPWETHQATGNRSEMQSTFLWERT